MAVEITAGTISHCSVTSDGTCTDYTVPTEWQDIALSSTTGVSAQGGLGGVFQPNSAPLEINPGEIFEPSGGNFDFGVVADLLDPIGVFHGTGPASITASMQPTQGGLGMVTGLVALQLPKLLIAFNLIGRAVKATNGRIPMSKGFLSRIMQLGTGLSVATVLGIDLWPFNNSSDRDQVQTMVEEALESGAIEDNRGYNRATGTMQPMRAIIILYDRMGEQVERMYAVSFRPVNGATAARSAVRSGNVIRRKRTASRRRA